MKALLIENSRLYHAYLSRQFAAMGYEPVIAESGASALECLASDCYQVVCMNLYFEGTNAIDFVREIRALASSRAKGDRQHRRNQHGNWSGTALGSHVQSRRPGVVPR